jgi:uncharacterized zinc-type alcohol dehydrogenase-like protein
MLHNDWGFSAFPLVAGHEVVGTVSALGSHVTHLRLGETVGLGWHAGYCHACHHCLEGDHNLCGKAVGTIVSHHGGFAESVRAQASSVFPLPQELNPAKAGPLFCGGITVFNPLVQYQISPTSKVGVIGIGGLGHLALQFCRAWGCEVTAFTSSDSKRQEALEMGAHHVISTADADALNAHRGTFDLILSTVNVTLNWGAFIGCLAPKGRLHFLGAALEPIPVMGFSLIGSQANLSGSPVGSPATIQKMLSFAARHHIEPLTETFPMTQINEALDHLRSGKARYRVVLQA